jgi:hypothetical protein
MARLDRLGDEKPIAQVASVVGRRVHARHGAILSGSNPSASSRTRCTGSRNAS